MNRIRHGCDSSKAPQTHKEGPTPKIEDTYAYNGDGLRMSQTASTTTTYLAWDFAEQLPLILNDGTSSFIYGPGTSHRANQRRRKSAIPEP